MVPIDKEQQDENVIKVLKRALLETNVLTKQEIKSLVSDPVTPGKVAKMVKQRLSDMFPQPLQVAKNYVLCIAYHESAKDNIRKYVFVVKNRPAWQAGLLNAPGGHIEDGETPLEACIREFKEETGIQTEPVSWQYVGKKCRKAAVDNDVNSYNMHVFVTDALSDEDILHLESLQDKKIGEGEEPIVVCTVGGLILNTVDTVPGLTSLVLQSTTSFHENSVFVIEEPQIYDLD